jgi:hypothetical protein
MFMLFSLPDISLLAFLVDSSPGIADSVSAVCRNLLAASTSFDFRFFRYECWDFDLYVFEKPDLTTSVPHLPSENKNLAQAASILCKFLMVAPEQVDEPPTLGDFLAFHEQRATFERDFKSQAILADLIVEVKKLGDDLRLLLEAFQFELKLRRSSLARNESCLMELSALSCELNRLCKSYEWKMEGTRSLLYSQMLQLFLSKNPEIMMRFNQRHHFCQQTTSFRTFFQGVARKLEDFLGASCAYAAKGAILHLHTQFMQQLRQHMFVKEHPKFLARDEQFAKATPQLIQELCGQWQSSQRQLLLTIAQAQLSAAMKVEIPLEVVERLRTLMQFLRALLRILGDDEDQLKPAMSCTILGMGSKNIFSFVKYLEFFLIDSGILDDDDLKNLQLLIEGVTTLVYQLGEVRFYKS